MTREIVGVSRQVIERAGEKEPPAQIYVPIRQNPWFSASIAVQTAGDPMSLLPQVKAAIARIDKDQPLTRVRTMEEVAAEATSQPRFRAELVGLSRCWRWCSRRLASSACSRFRWVSARASSASASRWARGRTTCCGSSSLGALKMTAAGVAIGLAAAALLTRFLGTLLFAVQPTDPVTFAGTAAILARRHCWLRAAGVARDARRSRRRAATGIRRNRGDR